jgi:8-oxo-dGTP pyrophosphatase MutT (NUDIX family)
MGQLIQTEMLRNVQARSIHQTPSEDGVQHQIIVAGVLERDGRYLVIEEMVDGRRLINQPAGRLQIGESALEGAIRETREESGYGFIPNALVGVYHWHNVEQRTIFLRLAFTGELIDQYDAKPSDPNTLEVRWLSIPELEREVHRHRSPFVLQAARDHAAGKRYPLDLVSFFSDWI